MYLMLSVSSAESAQPILLGFVKKREACLGISKPPSANSQLCP